MQLVQKINHPPKSPQSYYKGVQAKYALILGQVLNTKITAELVPNSIEKISN